MAAVDLRGRVLFGEDLSRTRLHNASITVNCDTFDGVRLSNEQVALFLMLISMADIDSGWKRGLVSLVEAQVGEYEYRALLRYLQLT